MVHYFTNLVLETENATKISDAQLHHTHHTLATKQLQQILNSNKLYNILHKRTLY
jgi:hypothetical protein